MKTIMILLMLTVALMGKSIFVTDETVQKVKEYDGYLDSDDLKEKAYRICLEYYITTINCEEFSRAVNTLSHNSGNIITLQTKE